MYSAYHAKYYAHELTRRHAADGVDRLSQSLFDASVDLNPHQIYAALFALRNPLQEVVLLADEVGLGKTIEAALVVCQYWAERRRRLLVICPASLRKQWAQELHDKFAMPITVVDAVSMRKQSAGDMLATLQRQVGQAVVIMSYQFAARLEAELRAVPWDMVVIDEAHKLRNAHRTSNRTGQPDMLAHAYRLSHPLGEWSIEASLNAVTPVATLKLDYGKHGARVSVIEELRGKSGWLTLARLEVTAFETTEALLFSGLIDDGQILDQETCEKLMAIPAAGKPKPLNAIVPEALLANSQRAVAATIAQVLEANQRLFNEERDKLERWADDKLLAAEEVLKNTKARIAQLKRDARNAVTLQEQDGIQRELSEQERKQRRLRQEIFTVEDEIIAKRDELIASLQQRLQEKTSNETLFSVRWQVI
ncbi:DEAD/DEAH box helicase family protein [Proteus mirabilis]|nr:DEAD/DEAH box helicase family protein [Proteus mirabilis]